MLHARLVDVRTPRRRINRVRGSGGQNDGAGHRRTAALTSADAAGIRNRKVFPINR